MPIVANHINFHFSINVIITLFEINSEKLIHLFNAKA